MTTPILSVILDANILIPFEPRDTFLRAAEKGVFRIRWSEQILEEVERNLIGKLLKVQPEIARRSGAAKTLAAMRDAFPGAPITGYEPLVEQMLNHSGDRHIAAAAWHAQADSIVTLNLRHFPAAALAPFNLRAIHPDDFLLQCFRASPSVFVEIVREQVRDRIRPRQTATHVLDGVAFLAPTFAAAVRERMAARSVE